MTKLGNTLSLVAMLGIQQMFGGFGSDDVTSKFRDLTIQGVGKPPKQRHKVQRKIGKHRRTYTHGKAWAR